MSDDVKIPDFHPETHSGKRGKTYSYWWSFRGKKHRSRRFKDKDTRDLSLMNERAKYATNVTPKLTSLSNEEVKEAELCRQFANGNEISNIMDALAYYKNNYKSSIMGPSLGDAIERFINDKTLSALSPRSIREYRLHFGDIVLTFGKDFSTGTMTEEIARNYLARWGKKSLLTYSHRRRTMAALWQWLANKEEVPSNPLKRIPNPNNNGRLSRGKSPSFYTVQEAKSILESCRDTGLLGFFALSMFGGVRTEEIQRLQQTGCWESVKFETGVIYIEGKKQSRRITMNETLRSWLKVVERNQKPFFSASHWQDSKKLKRSVLSKDRARMPNLARHTYITYALNLPGASYAEVSRTCGNSEGVIKSHYEGIATGEQAEAFFALTPENVS